MTAVDDFVARHDLVPAERIRRLSRRSDAKGLARLAVHAVLIAATGAAVWAARETWWMLPAMAAYGVAVVFLFCGFHECIHRTAFRSRWLNDGVAAVIGLIIFYPPFQFGLYHFAHHRFTRDPARDPELHPPPPVTRAGRLRNVTGLSFWPAQLRMTLRPALTGRIRRRYVRDRDARACVSEARRMWAAYAAVAALSLALGSWAAVVFWIGPMVLGQPFLRLYLLAEHTGCARNDDMTANTRTILTNAAVRLLAWNMPYHAEHHLFPSVPFHALPGLHDDVKGSLKVVDPGYIAVHRKIWRCLTGKTEFAHG